MEKLYHILYNLSFAFLIQSYAKTEVDLSTYSALFVSLAQSSGQQKKRPSEKMSLLTAALCWLIKIQDQVDNKETKKEWPKKSSYTERKSRFISEYSVCDKKYIISQSKAAIETKTFPHILKI